MNTDWKKICSVKCTSLILAAFLMAGGPARPVLAAPGPSSETGAAQTVSVQAESAEKTAEQIAAELAAVQAEVEKPEIEAEGAILYDATRNLFLYEKNSETRYYPASITKLMTALLVAEQRGMDEIVTFSEAAVTNLESGAVTLNIKAGEKLLLKDCMYGLLVRSANEVANGLAEHVAGSITGFVDQMNQKAASLGCTNTHFANPSGLNDSEHYSTARDMALIAKAAFDNEIVRTAASTLTYDFPATEASASGRKLTMGHKMLDPDREEYYPGIIGGKTGYTSLAGNTLVTCVERDGTRLITVILKSRQTHYADTKKLLDYGFAVAEKLQAPESSQNVAESSQVPESSQGTSESSQAPESSQGTSESSQAPGSSQSTSESSQAPGTGQNTWNSETSLAYPGAGQNVTVTWSSWEEESEADSAEDAASENSVSPQTGASDQGPGQEASAALQAAPSSQNNVTGQQTTQTVQQTASAGQQTTSAGQDGRNVYQEASGTWEKAGDSWKFKKADGTYASGEYRRIDGEVYGFDADGLMLVGWHMVNGSWHYFRESGKMTFNRWIETNGYWYYVDENGSLFVNGTTPDGYQVDANGLWIQ